MGAWSFPKQASELFLEIGSAAVIDIYAKIGAPRLAWCGGGGGVGCPKTAEN